MNNSDNKKTRKFFIAFACVLIPLLLICMFFIAYIDPFFVYRLNDDTSNYTWDQDYAPTWKVGLSKHQQGFDAIWVGSSLSTHVNTDYVKQQLGYNCMTGIIASGRPNVYRIFIEEALENNNIKAVFYETVISHWMWEYIGTKYDMSWIPDYVLTDSVLDDGKYLLNKDVLGQALIVGHRELSSYLQRKNAERSPGDTSDTGFEAADSAENSQDNGKAEIQNQIIPHDASFSIRSMAPRISSNTTQNVDNDILLHFGNTGKKTIRDDIIPIIENNPDVQFIFVVPPTGIMTFSQLKNAGLLNTYLEIEEELFAMLLHYDNVRIICAASDREFNTDLDNYMDDGHFCPQGAYNEIDYIKDHKYELTKENIHEELSEFIEISDNFEWPFLKEGFLGDEVKMLQDRLIALGYQIDEYGTYGPLTRDAITDFQQSRGLEVTGIAFEDTLTSIFSE